MPTVTQKVAFVIDSGEIFHFEIFLHSFVFFIVVDMAHLLELSISYLLVNSEVSVSVICDHSFPLKWLNKFYVGRHILAKFHKISNHPEGEICLEYEPAHE